MESYILELHPNRPVYFGLFQNVTNADELHARFVAQDESFGLCLINAQMVFDKRHLLLAANRAIHDEQTTKIKTANIHSEVAFGFAMNNNIGKTLIRFGINKDTKDIIVVRIGSDNVEQAESYVKQFVKGDLVPFDNLTNIRNIEEIKKVYGIDSQLKENDTIMALVTGAIALRGH